MVAKYCLVRNCVNSSWQTPKKLFIRIPVNRNTKEKWFKAMNVESTRSKATNLQFCCEDHFDLQNDSENFMAFKMIGARLRMKKTAVPHLNLNINNKIPEETQFTLSAQELRKRNIEELQIKPPPSKKQKKTKADHSYPTTKSTTTTTTSSVEQSEASTPSENLTDKDIQTNLNAEFVYSLCKYAIKSGINRVKINKDNRSMILNIEETNTDSLQLCVNQETAIDFENVKIINEDQQLTNQEIDFNIEKNSQNIVKQEPEKNLEDVIQEFVVIEDCEDQNEQLTSQEINIELNIEEKNQISLLSSMREEAMKNLENDTAINKEFIADKHLTSQIIDLNNKQKEETEINVSIITLEDSEVEDNLPIKEELIAVQDEQLSNQEIDLNIEEKNKIMVKQETKEEFIKIEDSEYEDEQLTNQKMNMKLVIQETDKNIEDNPTIKEEFISFESCEDQEEIVGLEKEFLENSIIVKEEIPEFEDIEDTGLIKHELESVNTEEFKSKDEKEPNNPEFEFVPCSWDYNKTGPSSATKNKISHNVYNRVSPTNFSIESNLSENMNPELSCYICNEVFPDTALLKKHVNTHEESKRFECSICKKRFRINSALQTHLKIHTGIKTFECLICKKLFLLKSYLKIHLEHKNLDCPKCQKKFVVRCALKKHMKQQHQEKHTCLICKKQFQHKSYLKLHTDSVHFGIALKKFECHICGKKFAVQCTLNEHIDWHTGIKRHQCLYCNKRFRRKESLYYHRTVCSNPEVEC